MNYEEINRMNSRYQNQYRGNSNQFRRNSNRSRGRGGFRGRGYQGGFRGRDAYGG